MAACHGNNTCIGGVTTMKNKKAGMIIFLAIVFWITVSAVVLFWQRAKLQEITGEIRVFQSIDEVQLSSGTTIKEEIKTDAYLDGLEVSESYCKKLLYKGKQVSLYAYVFAEESDAREYFQKFTGKNTKNAIYNFSWTSGLFSASNFIAYNGNCLYRLYSKNNSALTDVLKSLSSNFSIVIC